MLRLIPLFLVTSLLAGCGNSSEKHVDDDSSPDHTEASYSYSEDEEKREPFDEDAAREKAEEELASEGYDYRYGCTYDCSGHEAGWQWRAENGYSTYGKSRSFAEGGEAFDDAVEERLEEMRSDYDDGYEPDY